ncbi:MAG: cyclic nucleotide-binding domain-containing protein [Acidimicrobiia bacterium]|nr:cyclic nucleotide-binding domain-containing protein [Acidimicrobiia bacterium]
MTETQGTVDEYQRIAASRNEVVTRRDELGITNWDIALLIATVVIAVVIPLEVVFGPLRLGWLMVISAVASLLFAGDIWVRRRRPITVRGIRVVDRSWIQRRYMRRWFTVDLLAAIPFDLLAVAPGIDGSSAASVLRILSLLRVLRVARILALQRDWRVHTSINPALLRLAFFAFWIAMISHWIACGWIALDGADSGHPELAPYQQALYWTITTLTTVGYGDITPVGRNQVAYAMVVMALGAAMYGYIIGNVASLLANLDVNRARHLGRLEAVNNFMRDRQVPRDLQAQVRDYYNYLWESRMVEETEMLEGLPTPLRVEIALHINQAILQKVPLFERADETFLRELVLHFTPTVGVPGESIVQRGEIGHRIYFINRGTVEVLGADDREVVATLTDGDFFGEMALLGSDARANTVRAVDYCDLYALDRERFNRVLETFPAFAAEVRRIADARRAENEPGS